MAKWVKGQSGNPNPKAGPGRLPGRGLAKYIREQTGDGFMLARFHLAVVTGQKKGCTVRDQQVSAAWLADRGFGKALEMQLQGEMDAADNPLAEFDTEQLKALVRTISSVSKPSLQPGSAPHAAAAALPAAADPAADAAPAAKAPESQREARRAIAVDADAVDAAQVPETSGD